MRVARFGILSGAVVGVTLLALANVASAIPLTLTGPIAGNTVGPQSTSNPCIIAATQCSQPATMGFNNFTSSGAISSYNMYSTTPTATVADGVQGNPYTVGQLETALGSSTFVIAIDVNTTQAAGETLQLFEVIINGVVAYNYVGPTVIGGVNNNGNGFGDWTLGTVDLSALPDASTVLFHAVWNNATDGGESFFLVPGTPTPPPVPEAGTLLLVGSGLVGLAAFARKKLHR